MTSDMPLAELDRQQLGTDLQSDGTDKLYQQLAAKVPEVWPVLMLIAKAAERRGWSLYIVGGAVRDLLLGMLGDTRPLTDIDLVVEACQAESAATIEGAGVVLAEAIRTEYAQVEVQVHGQFQTAVLTWHSWQIDIATARTEHYPYPAANPEVESSDIRRDLYRRDFTVNAIALRLTDQLTGQLTGQLPDPLVDQPIGTSPGQLIDLFGGWSDLRQRLVRVLHENSFIDDPTRIFRGVRFAVRLGFDLEAQTEQLIRMAVNSGVYDKSRAQHEKVPALQSRLRAELKYLLEEAGWEKSLVQLDNLGALVCIDPQLAITPELLRQLRRMDRWLHKFDTGQPRWLLLLELLLAQLEVDRASQSAQTLNLGSQSQYRLRHIHAWESHLEVHLGPRLGKLSGQSQIVIRPSQVFELLRSHSRAELLLMAARHPRTIGPSIWQYITRLADVPTLINGATLKRLGYPPGPRFKEILTDIHRQQLDGKLATADSAEQYVLTYHPQ